MDNNTIKDIFLRNGLLFYVLPELLKDRTTGKNIVWATDTYSEYGAYYHKECQMFPELTLNLIYDGIMLPRVQKSKAQQQSRTRNKAEVFTPSWICNKMNNYCDEQWFMRKNVFNTENPDNTWTVTEGLIEFGEQQNKRCEEWQRYVDSKRIEITCGEAPYLVSRYDAATGEYIEIKNRIGIIDRKLRVTGENTRTEKDWLRWAERAYEASYGFEYQGDSLFFARVNLVQSFIEYYTDRFGKTPSKENVRRIANIVSWNIWQMDGLKDTVPFGIPDDEYVQLDLFGDDENKGSSYCRIKDWRSKKIIEYRELKGDK